MDWSLSQWATRSLKIGDLTELATIAAGAASPKATALQRLMERRFVVRRRNGRLDLTVRGRVALAVKRSRH
jgi:hypothetical protein